MKIKELEEKSGVPRTTIHFYLRQGLLHPPRKTSRTIAHYDNSHLAELKKIQGIKKGSRVPVSFLKKQMASTRKSTPPASDRDSGVVFGKPSPTTREKKQKHQLIIRKAIEIFSTQGYHSTKIADITNALKISTGTFYIYFRNKQDLFIQVIDHVFQTIVEEAENALKGIDDISEKMIVRGRVFYKNYTKHSELLNQLRAEMTRKSDWPAEKISNIYHGLTRPLIQDLQKAIDDGVIRSVDPELTAYSITGQIEILSLRMTLDDKYTYDDILEYQLESTVNMLMEKKDAKIAVAALKKTPR